ncbi:MAG TPA: hypothetical protein VM513_12245 [Kofleriaceae bacterium]|nr:hypothetical protein [Kofleriaceae bacterium]
MPLRLLALLLLFAVVPTAELVEQTAHLVGHAFEAEAADHSAHHDDTQSDEHGCTGLVHLCACHQTQVTQPPVISTYITAKQLASLPAVVPQGLADQHRAEPAQRPPIA